MESNRITKYIDDYISNDRELVKLLTRFDKPIYIKKHSTGMGLTHIYLHHCLGQILILSPNVGMVESKALKDKRENAFYIYQKAEGKWNKCVHMASAGNNVVVNATADSLLMLKEKNEEMYNKVLHTFNIVIDEWHAIFNNDFSESLPRLYNVICDAKKPYVVTTATAICPELEVPENVDIIEIRYKTPPLKKVTIYPRIAGSDATNALLARFVTKSIQLGLKPTIATNDPKRLSICQHLTKELLAGEKMNAKSKLRTKIAEVNQLSDAEMAFFSTRYNTGTDFLGLVSVCAIADGYSNVDCKSIQEVIQALGRSRPEQDEESGYRNATIIYKEAPQKRNAKTIINEIKTFDRNKADYASNTRALFKELQMAQTYSCLNSFVKQLEDYDITVEVQTQPDVLPIRESTALVQSVRYLMLHDFKAIMNSYYHVINNIQGDALDCDLYTSKVVTTYMVWRLINLSLIDFEKLEQFEIQDQQGRIIPYILKSVTSHIPDAIRSLDWLRVMQCTKHAKDICTSDEVLPLDYEEKLRKWMLTRELTKELYHDAIIKELGRLVPDATAHVEKYGSENIGVGICMATGAYTSLSRTNINKNMEEKFQSALQEWNLPYDEKAITQLEKIREKVKDEITSRTNSLHQLLLIVKPEKQSFLDKHSSFCKFLFCLKHELYLNGFSISNVKNREYNPAVKRPRVFKKLNPFYFYDYDIDQAHPTIIDILNHSSHAPTLYDTIAKNHNITRDEAKVMFNKALNNHYDKDRKATFKSFGYSDADAHYLDTVGREKGAMHELLAQIEKQMVDEFVSINRLKRFARTHDGVISFEEAHTLRLYNEQVKFSLKN